MSHCRFMGLSPQTFFWGLSAFFVVLTELSHPIQSIEPEPLWVAINITLKSVDKAYNDVTNGSRRCVKIILYNEDAEAYANRSLVGSDELVINVDGGNPPDGFMSETLVSKVRDAVMKPRDLTKCQPCLVVISLVNTTKQVELMAEMSENELDELKLKDSLQFAKMLQFRMPLHSRHLILVRFGRSSNEFGQCRKKHPYLKYPRRLVPLWEQVLFDYFPEARVLLAVNDMNTVPTRKEEANFVWLCEEIMTRLDKEDECKKNMTEICKETMDNGGFSISNFDRVNCLKQTPRM